MTEPTPSINLADLQRIFEAARFAAEKHAQQKRKGAAGEAYINHLLEVAELIAGSLAEPDTNLVIAALLHDVLEDTPTTKEELVTRFGSDVADLVAEVTDDKSLPKAERKHLQIETAPLKSVRAQTIKIADKISNLRSILHSPPADWDYQRKSEYFAWAKQVIDAFAAPNPILKAEFDATVARFAHIVREGSSAKSAETLNVMWVNETEPGVSGSCRPQSEGRRDPLLLRKSQVIEITSRCQYPQEGCDTLCVGLSDHFSRANSAFAW